ncbi:U2 snRNP complex subunit [Taxawa tesnikishii (nom. ined.)]|nr:U2 snRNP complex subunit [Dothideales sp. JES 119]
MRLSAELIQNSLSYLNPLNERELDLRGHKIPTIENLGVASPQDAIDFTDNDITVIANFPKSPRLQSLYFARNRISSIDARVTNNIPNLKTLVLTQNQISELADLDPLAGLRKLTHLTLIDNPVTSKENYRYWVLYRCPSVRFLDFQKVKDAERQKAKELFGTTEEPTDLAKKVAAIRSNKPAAYTSAAPALNGAGKNFSVRMSDKDRKRVERMVRNAKTLQEITVLEKALNEGRIPAGMLADDDGMDTS